MAASAWQFQYSTNISKNPTAVSATAWEFNLPVNPSNNDGVHYLVTTPPVLAGKNTLTMSGLIKSGAGIIFVPLTEAGHVDTSGARASCGFYFEELAITSVVLSRTGRTTRTIAGGVILAASFSPMAISA
jgi:hypothetical protein